MTIEDIARSEGIWGSPPQESPDVVLKSSLQYFRNVDGYAFSHKLPKKEKDQLVRLLLDCIRINEIYPEFNTFRVDELFPNDRKILHERNILKEERTDGGTLVIDPQQRHFFLLCGLEHLDFVAERSGFNFDELYAFSKSVLFSIEKKLEFSFSQRYGYLTANPKNSGAALQACSYLHLPGLVISGRINEAASELDKKGYALRSSWVEGYYEIFNKVSTGISEKELFDGAVSSFRSIMELEIEVRESEYKANKRLIEDKIWRSYGILMTSRIISLYESLELLSSLRLGVSLGILTNLTIKDVNLLLYFTQDFHLRKRYSIKDMEQNMEETRAQFLRDYMKEVT